MAAYYFYRRMLSYYMELSQQAETRNAAKQIASMMKNEKAVILKYMEMHMREKETS